MTRSASRARLATLAVVVAPILLPACARTLQPSSADIALAFAVRTALVNDPAIGAAPIDIQVHRGVVTLEGRVASAGERARATALAAGVPGVVRTVDRLVVSAATREPVSTGSRPAETRVAPPAGQGRLSAVPRDDAEPPRHFAIGGLIGVPSTRSAMLDGDAVLSPTFRFGRGDGWHPEVAWTRLRADLPPAPGTSAFGDLRLNAITVGLAYGLNTDRVSFNPALTIGYSFNHIRLDPGFVVPPGTSFPVAVSGSFATMPDAVLWYEATRRVSVGVSVGYLFARPRATWLEGDRFHRRQLNADSLVVGIRAAYWMF